MPDVIIDCLNNFATADEITIGSKHKDKEPPAVTKVSKKSRDRVQPPTEPSVEAVIRIPTPHVPPEFVDLGTFHREPVELSNTTSVETIGTIPVSDVETYLDTTHAAADLLTLPELSDIATHQSDTGNLLGTAMVDGLKKSQRLAAKLRHLLDVRIGHMRAAAKINHISSIKKAVAKYGEAAIVAIIKELKQLVAKKVFRYVQRGDLTPLQRSKSLGHSCSSKKSLMNWPDFKS
jgi:hypothetical protein